MPDERCLIPVYRCPAEPGRRAPASYSFATGIASKGEFAGQIAAPAGTGTEPGPQGRGIQAILVPLGIGRPHVRLSAPEAVDTATRGDYRLEWIPGGQEDSTGKAGHFEEAR